MVADPALTNARVFRIILEAMARPGRIYHLDDAIAAPPLSAAATAIAQTLVDGDAPAWVMPAWHTPALERFLRFETGQPPLTEQSGAAFLFGTWPVLASSTPALGTAEYPDRSATLVIEVPVLEAHDGVRLTGPGIAQSHSLHCNLSVDFWEARAENHALFPLGWDAILTCGGSVAALPRTARAEP